MVSVTLSSKCQLGLPKAIREELGLQAEQKFSIIAKGGCHRTGAAAQDRVRAGLLKGANPDDCRDRSDRY